MPLYKSMKKATFSDSEDEVCLHVYMFTLQLVFKSLQTFVLLIWIVAHVDELFHTEPKYCL